MARNIDVSRRTFVTGAAAATFASAVGLAGCTPVAKTGEKASGEGTSAETFDASSLERQWSFEIPPTPIGEDEITKTVTADIVVVGSGVAGLTTAVAAREQGADVVVVTAGTRGIGRGGSTCAFGSKVQKELGVDVSEDEIRELIKFQQSSSAFFIDAAKWADWINHSAESMDWLIDLFAARGIDTDLEPGYEDPDGTLSVPPVAHNFITKEAPEGYRQSAHLQAVTLEDIFVNDLGGTMYCKTPVKQLIRGGVANGTTGRVEGCIALTEEGEYIKFEARRAVVLATGDFSRDKDMMAKYCPWGYETFNDVMTWDVVDYDTEDNWSGLMHGDGHKMALWVGAAWQKTNPNPPVVCVGIEGPLRDPLANFWGINMNVHGKRYMNETTNSAYAGINITRQPDATAFGVWDADYAKAQDRWNYYGCNVGGKNGFEPYTPEQLIETWEGKVKEGMYFKADTIEELVDILAENGLRDKEAALATIADYNRYAAQGRDDEYQVNPSVLRPVATPPFYGCKRVGNVFLTVCGGIRTDASMQALDADDNPIEGLYTTGIMTGDFYGNVYNFVFPGLNLGGVCGTLSYLLGRRLAD